MSLRQPHIVGAYIPAKAVPTAQAPSQCACCRTSHGDQGHGGPPCRGRSAKQKEHEKAPRSALVHHIQAMGGRERGGAGERKGGREGERESERITPIRACACDDIVCVCARESTCLCTREHSADESLRTLSSAIKHYYILHLPSQMCAKAYAQTPTCGDWNRQYTKFLGMRLRVCTRAGTRV